MHTEDPFAVPEQRRFKVEMPRIPGVKADNAARSITPSTLRLVLVAAAVLAVVGGVAWHSARSAKRSSATKDEASAPVEAPLNLPAPRAVKSPVAPGAIGTIADFPSAWSSRKFDFVNPETGAISSAMVIRLPGVAATRSDAYWGFALAAPYGRCDLDYAPDPASVKAQYGYRAQHPMVVSACDGTLYDPLRLGTLPSGAWARGDVVQGPGIRPPMAVEIRVQGQNVVADRMEQ